MKKTLILLMLGMLSIISCSRLDTDIIESSDNVITETEYDSSVMSLAKAINYAIRENDDFRKLIKDEVVKMFDGDYDLLLTTAFDKRINASSDLMTRSGCRETISVKELLSYYYSDSECLTKSSLTILDDLIEEYPDLQISVPVHADEWDPTSYTPAIAVIPADYEEFETKTVPGIAPEGNMIEIDAINSPNDPVIVIGMNERVAPLVIVPGFGSGPKAVLEGFYSSGANRMRVTLSSMPSSSIIVSIKLYRAGPNNNNFTNIGNISLINNQYTDWNIVLNKEYSYYAVVNYNLDGKIQTLQSNMVTVSTIDTFPNAISNLTVTNEYATKNHLEWNNPSTNNFETQIFKTTPSITYQLIATLPPTQTEYYDEPTAPGEKWIYSVKKHNPNTDEVSLHNQTYIYNPYRNPSDVSKVMMKEVKVGSSAESWLDGKPEILVTVYGQKFNAVTGEIETAVLGTVDYKFEKNSSVMTGLNNLMTDWSFFDDSTYYPILNINMREYDRSISDVSLTLEAKCGYKYQDSIDLVLNGSVSITMNKKNKDCGIVYLRYYENPEQTLTFSNHNAYIKISETDDNNS